MEPADCCVALLRAEKCGHFIRIFITTTQWRATTITRKQERVEPTFFARLKLNLDLLLQEKSISRNLKVGSHNINVRVIWLYVNVCTFVPNNESSPNNMYLNRQSGARNTSKIFTLVESDCKIASWIRRYWIRLVGWSDSDHVSD